MNSKQNQIHHHQIHKQSNHQSNINENIKNELNNQSTLNSSLIESSNGNNKNQTIEANNDTTNNNNSTTTASNNNQFINNNNNISPNAKLLSNFNLSSQTTSPNNIIKFPLKSSFKIQSNSIQNQDQNQSFNFSLDYTSLSNITPSSILKYNTQFNSITPNQNQNSDQTSNQNSNKITKIKSNLPIQILSPSPIITTTTSTTKDQTDSDLNNIPHRIIRTPRSFLIKRRGSLTPLNNSITTNLISNQNKEEINHNEIKLEKEEIDNKRKVRFDHEVFCLEFDQLPEELPLSRQKRLKLNNNSINSNLIDLNQSNPDDSQNKSQKRNLRSRNKRTNSTVNSTTITNRPRRHSPRLPPINSTIKTEEEESIINDNTNNDSEIKTYKEENEKSPSTSLLTAADISSLSLNPPSDYILITQSCLHHFPLSSSHSSDSFPSSSSTTTLLLPSLSSSSSSDSSLPSSSFNS